MTKKNEQIGRMIKPEKKACFMSSSLK